MPSSTPSSLLRWSLRLLAGAGLLAAVATAGCSDNTGSSDQFSGERVVACSAAELDPIVACSAEPCADLSGDALTECMDQNCPETVWEVSENCGACLVSNLYSVDGMVAGCGSARAASAAACSAAEVEPLVACAAEACDTMGGDALMQCMDDNCPETVWEVSEGCANCMIANQMSFEAMTGTCGGASEAATAVAPCSTAETDPIVACATEPCSGLTGDALNECIDANCPETVFQGISEDCGTCLVYSLQSVEALAACSAAPAPSAS
jgi:hypothetical protein